MNTYTELKPIPADETFNFECKSCGDCCRDIRSQVMIESLDLFNIAKHLKLEIAEAAEQYTEVALLCWGAPVLMLKTKIIGDVCVFLKSGKCEIQQAKPRACRLYPLSMGPDKNNLSNVLVFKSTEKSFHYKGQTHVAGEWVADNMDSESHAYVITEYRLLRELGNVLRLIAREREYEVNNLMLMYRYFLFDTEKNFMLQYVKNMAQLKKELEKLIKF